MMKKEKSDIRPTDCDVVNLPPSDTAKEQVLSNRRELIGHFGKAAIIGAPMLLFVSSAHAIHSKP